MRVLHVVPNFYPATKWGGPIFSTKAICDGIAAMRGVDLRVLTTDAASPTRGDAIRPATLPYDVNYARRIAGHSVAPGLLARLPGAIAWADVVHLTATYNFPTLPTLAIAKTLRRPVVWSPRGALQATAEWSGAPNLRIKHLFERMADVVRPRASVLHVTSMAEGQDSTKRLPDMLTTLIPNCVQMPRKSVGGPRADDTMRLIYLGRLHPKKGLDRLFEAMATLPRHITLDIYGTGDADYVAGLHDRAANYGDRIRLHGHVSGAAKARAFANADLFVLPTYSENFGIAVAEALAHSVPVITTTATPWQGLDARDCGRCVDLVKTSLADEIIALANADLAAMGARGRMWMARDFSPDAMAAAFADLYRSLLPNQHQEVPA